MYTDAIPIESLSNALDDILSPKIASTYFARPVNVSGDQTYDDPAAPEIGAHELRAELERTGRYPSRESLVPRGGLLHRALLQQYEDDIVFGHS